MIIVDDSGQDPFEVPLIPKIKGVTIWRCWWEVDDEARWCFVAKSAVKDWTAGLKAVGVENIWYVS